MLDKTGRLRIANDNLRCIGYLRALLIAVVLSWRIGAATYTVSAEEAADPQIVFTNEQKGAADLYVSKTTTSAVEGYDVPEATFSFSLKLAESPAAEAEYELYDKDGNEIVQTDSLGNKLPYKTDKTGGFSLGAGQTAKFVDVGKGVEYEVSETPLEGFTQIAPSGGTPAIGTVEKNGSIAAFTNEYMPTIEAETTQLRISKSVVYPAGYDLPDDPEFEYTIYIDGELYTQMDCKITDSSTGADLSKSQTDQKGVLRLKAGQTATFEDIPTNVDYKVIENITSEQQDKGWRILNGDENEEGVASLIKKTISGATEAPATIASFTNVMASFAVKKTMSDGSKPDEKFTFTLSDEDSNARQGESYYLYSTDGKLIDTVTQKTDGAGQFKLAAGQVAVFTGIPEGEIYNVSEQGGVSSADKKYNYVQQFPASAKGYTNKKVKDSVETLSFVNEPQETDNMLTVTKSVVGEDGDFPLTNDYFWFILSKANDSGGYDPVANAVFYVKDGDNDLSYKTDTTGKFGIQANQVARFTKLKKGNYKVEEVELPERYSVYEPTSGSCLGELSSDGLSFAFTNLYTPIKTDLAIRKKGERDENLAGAEFVLYRDRNLTNPVSENVYRSDDGGVVRATDDGGNIITGSEGYADLKPGTYYLKETKAPEGYYLPTEAIKIRIVVKDDKTVEFYVDGEKYTQTDESGDMYIKYNDDKNNMIYITAYNMYYGIPTNLNQTGLSAAIAIVLLFGGAAGAYILLFKKGSKKET